MYKFNGQDWTLSSDNKAAYFRAGESDLNATFTYNNDGTVDANISCDDTKAGRAYEKALIRKGYDCANSTAGVNYKINVESQK